MFQIAIPATEATNFEDIFRNEVENEIGGYFGFYDRINNGTYIYFQWEQSSVTYEMARRIWDKYDQYDRAITELGDGSFIVHAGINKNLFNIYTGKATVGASQAETEAEWIDSVKSLLNEMEFNIPLEVEFNPIAHALNRAIPTVVLLGREVWKNQGQPVIVHSPAIIAYKKYANLAYFPYHITTQRHFYFVEERPANHILTPFCVIKKNRWGIGNTVLLNNIQFSSETIPGMKTIFELLQEEFIWKNIIIPLATEDFDELKAVLDSQEVPLLLQAKAFRIQSQSGILQEIADFQVRKEEAIKRVEDQIRYVTEIKLEIDNLDRQLEEKQKSLQSNIDSNVLEKEFEKVTSLPYVKSIGFTNAGMTILTEPIQIDDGPVLGGYKIVYNPNGRVLNIFNEVNPMMADGVIAHPHIPQGGQPCFGNYTDIFFRFEKGEFYIGMELLHKFLATYNPEDLWGRRLVYWDAPFFFRDMKERELARLIPERYDSQYFEEIGEHLPHVRICSGCGRPSSLCECNTCRTCGNHMDDCTCWICPNCGENIENGDCECDRCEQCNELIGDCECARCDICDGLLDPNGYYVNHCTCLRCPEDYDYVVDPEDDSECRECENFDCEYNQNRTHPDHPDYVPEYPTQEETLFDEAVGPDQTAYTTVETTDEGGAVFNPNTGDAYQPEEIEIPATE
jgi:protocadherin alpha